MMSTQKYAHTFIAALFLIIKIWKTPRCPSIGKWIKKKKTNKQKTGCIHKMEQYLIIK